jgi:hypothetical protein
LPLALKFIIFQFLVVAPFAAGGLARKRFADAEGASRKLVMGNLVFLEPVIVLWTIWGLRLDPGHLLLPAAGICILLASIALGALFSRLLGLRDRRGPAYIVSSSLSNCGFTMGGFMAYLFLGETGLGLSFIYTLFYMPFVFIVVFPYARMASTGKYRLSSLREILGLQNMPLYAMAAAAALQAAGVPRPEIAFPVDPVIMASIVVYYFSLGLNFRMGDVKKNAACHAALGLTKFVVVPAAVFAALTPLGLDPAARAVIVIESFMPVAIYSVVTSVVFDLDSNFSSSLFVVNTALFLCAVLPALYLLRSFLLI